MRLCSIEGLLCSSITTSALDPGQNPPKEGGPDTPTPPEGDDQQLKDLGQDSKNVNEEKGQTVPENEGPEPELEEEAESDQMSKSTIPTTTCMLSLFKYQREKK